MEQHVIPQTLDAPPLLIVFNGYQVISFFVFTLVGVIINHPFYLAALGFAFGTFFTRYADKKPNGFLRHLLYFYGVPTISGRLFPNGFDRDFRP